MFWRKMIGFEYLINYMKKLLRILLMVFWLSASMQLLAQMNEGGVPLSFNGLVESTVFQEYDAGKPDFDKIITEDLQADQLGLPPRFAHSIPVNLNPENSGTWYFDDAGNAIWRLGIRAEGALALGLQFIDFNLPENASLFIYSIDHQQVIGAFTQHNNRKSGRFATALVDGDQCIVELNLKNGQNPILPFTLTEITYAYRYAGDDLKNGESSDHCEVNVNCSPEGDEWQNAKRGVVRIQIKVGGSSYWCSGSLLNNTSFDKTPYILTADHCAYQLGGYATTEDLESWLFYFNYEGLFCESEDPFPIYFSMSGATKIAQGGNRGSTGSDFYLVRLIDDFPNDSHVYFNGWSSTGNVENNGVTIHHPDGDIKKISTFVEPLVSSSWSGSGLPSHWKVIWSETLNGWGVTEGGSSGCPMFDPNGRIIGTLTGGLAACDPIGSIGPDKPDYYGKFAYHWESNGTTDTAQLKPWLDPLNLGVLFLNGLETGMQENYKSENTIKLFPNPATSVVNVEFTTFAPKDIQVTLMDLLGRTVIQQELSLMDNNLQIDLHGNAPGTYFLRLNFNQHTETHKILIR